MISSLVLMSAAFFSDISLNDGPYVFQKGKRFLVEWIDSGKLKKKYINQKNHRKFRSNDQRYFDTQYLFSGYVDQAKDQYEFHGVKNIAALSDVHGQFDLLIQILTNNNIIDQNAQWSFDDGHFVVVGDVFDRGEKVQECLWFLYQLEQQAAQAGGRVHFVLGNHEVMILTGDLRYIHQKYQTTAQLLKLPYDQIFGPASVLGQWLRTKPITVSINDVQFVHGGLSPALAVSKFTIREINETFKNKIIDAQPDDSTESDHRISFLNGAQGPIWYRGYFMDSSLFEPQIDKILAYYNKALIVVGHTSMRGVASFFDGKVIVVDSSIKLGVSGEILLIEDGAYFAGDALGVKRKLF